MLVVTFVAVLGSVRASSARAEAPTTQPPDEEVEHALRHLDGTTPEEVAWGAHHAAEHRIEAAVPRLVDLLRREDPDDTARLPLRIALLDALVVLDPPLDAAMLLPHAKGLLLHGVVTMLARHPDRHGAAGLALFRRLDPTTTAWVALGNALATARTPGFATAVLERLELTLSVRVFDRADAVRDDPTVSIPGCGVWRVPDRWPPTRLHRLFRRSDHRSDGLEFLGRHPVVSQRCGRGDREVWTCTSVESSDAAPDDVRIGWLAAWGCAPPGLEGVVRLDLVWVSDRDFLRRARAARERRTSALRALAAEVAWVAPAEVAPAEVAAGDAEAPRPRVRVVVEDRRAAATRRPLPALPEWGARGRASGV